MRGTVFLGACLALAGCRQAADTVTADRAWVRLAAAPGRPAAAYLAVHGGPDAARLLSVESRDAGASELHRSMTAGGMASMQRLDGLDVPARGTLSFAPGGNHVMLFGVAPSVRPGATMPLTLRFARGAPIVLDAKVVGAGDAPPY